MPVWAFLDELRLARLGLRNYWGYNPFAFMAPEPRYAVADPVAEFRAMVAALHGAGIEVVLDVVLNHTAETDHLGPTLSLRGLDNATYYRLDPADPSRYLDWAGCGNSLNLGHPRVLQLAMDALRHWAALGVDGFRFDLAPALGRDLAGDFRPDAALLQAIAQDPVLGGLKLIAEPWDLGPHGYRQGEFPPPFAMWNDRFRDCVRRFWRGDEGILPELAGRLLGSADLYEAAGRRPWVSVNLVTSHDGFTLADLVSHAGRHNEANGEHNRDGHHDNLSANHGVEGPTDDPRDRGAARPPAPATSWPRCCSPRARPCCSWATSSAARSRATTTPTARTTSSAGWTGRVRRRRIGRSPIWSASWSSCAAPIRCCARPGISMARPRKPACPTSPGWRPEGRAMTPADWQEPQRRCLGLQLAGADSLLLLLLNADEHDHCFVLPRVPGNLPWHILLDTAGPDGVAAADLAPRLAARSLVLLWSGSDAP